MRRRCDFVLLQRYAVRFLWWRSVDESQDARKNEHEQGAEDSHSLMPPLASRCQGFFLENSDNIVRTVNAAPTRIASHQRLLAYK